MATKTSTYIDLQGQSLPLDHLSTDERALVQSLQDEARQQPDWSDFANFWLAQVDQFYRAQGLKSKEIRTTVAYQVGSDLEGRLAVKQGHARLPDYRDDLELLIATKYRTRRAFCEATGIAEDMLSHVLARRKHLAIDTLTEALAKVGYTLHIAPLAQAS